MVLPALETPHLVLRPLRPEDVRAYRDLLPDLPNSLTGADRLFPDANGEELDRRAVAATGMLLTMQHNLPFSPRAVTRKADGCFLGYCGIRPLPPEIPARQAADGECELLYMLGRAFWGQGYASEAVAASVRDGFDMLKVPRITGLSRADNLASIRVMEKAGLVHDGPREGFGVLLQSWSATREQYDGERSAGEKATGAD